MATLQDQIMVTVSAAAGGAISEFNRLEGAARKTGGTVDDMGKKFGGLGDTLKSGLVAGAAAFVGTGLVKFLQDSVDAFGDAAKQAGELSTATGGSVEEISRMQAALQDAGISAEVSAGLITKFTQNAERNADELSNLNVELERGPDGSINYAKALVDTVDAIGNLGDAAERNRLLVEFFGKKGAIAFQELYASGVDLADAMEAISKYRVFNADDVARAVAYDDAMDGLSAAMQEVQFSVGRALIPLISDMVEAFADVVGAVSPVIELLGEIPGETLAMVGAFTALNAVLKSTLVTNAVSYAGTFVATMVTSFVAVQTGAVTMSAAISSAMTKMTTALLANPVTAVLVLVAAGMAAVQFASKNAQDEVAETAGRWKDLEDAGMTTADALNQTAEEWLKSASAWDKVSLASENWGWLKNAGLLGGLIEKIKGGNPVIENFKDLSADAREEMGEFAFESGLAAQEQKELNDLLAAGATNNAKLRDAVAEAGAAQAEKNSITEQSNALMETYAATHEGAVDAVRDLFDAQFDARGAQRDYNDALKEYTELDPKATADEHSEALDNVLQSALDLADGWAEERRQALENQGITLTQVQTRQLQIDKLKEIRDAAVNAGVPQSVIDSYDTMIGTLETAQETASGGIEVDVSIATMTPEEIQGKITELQNRVRDAAQSGNFGLAEALQAELDALLGIQEGGVAVDVNTTFTSTGYEEVDAQVAALAEPQTASITIDATFTPDGYNAIKARRDALLEAGETALVLDTSFSPDGYNALKARKDYLKEDVSGTVTINTIFSPDGYNALKARKDYLSQDRTATITFRTNGLSAAVAALSAAGADSQAANQQFKIPQFTAPQPINIVKVSVDGKQLRATIREELGLIRASDDYAAARGVMA